MPEKPLVILDPFPRRVYEIFSKKAYESLESNAKIIVYDKGDGSMPEEQLDSHISEAVVIIGQPDLPAERLSKARNLKGVINVETNFFPNVDYEFCSNNGIYVITPGSAFAPVVAETSLGMAIDLARGISASDRAFRDNLEEYGLESNKKSFSLFNTTFGIIGYGDLGRTLHGLLKPFGGSVKAYDPWLPEYYLEKQGVEPASLDEVLKQSRVIFVFASVSSENQGFLDASKLELIQDNSVFLLMSRAAVVNWKDLLNQAGRLKIGTDVFPQEPIAKDDPIRQLDILLSAHRAGAMVDALYDIGDQTVADAKLLLKGLPPIVCRKAMRETVTKLRSKPVEKT